MKTGSACVRAARTAARTGGRSLLPTPWGRLTRAPGARLVAQERDLPVRCPVAPLAFLFLAHGSSRHRGMSLRVQLVHVGRAIDRDGVKNIDPTIIALLETPQNMH
jgi:hypothetical protein